MPPSAGRVLSFAVFYMALILVLSTTASLTTTIGALQQNFALQQTTTSYSWYCVSSDGVSRYCNRNSFETPARGCYFVLGVREVVCVNNNYQLVDDQYCLSTINNKPELYDSSAVITDCLWKVFGTENQYLDVEKDDYYTRPNSQLTYPLKINALSPVMSTMCPPCPELVRLPAKARQKYERLKVYDAQKDLMCWDAYNNKLTENTLCNNVNLDKPQLNLNCTATCLAADATLPTQPELEEPKYDSPRWVTKGETCTGCSLVEELKDASAAYKNSLQFAPNYAISTPIREQLLTAHGLDKKKGSMQHIATGLGKRTFECKDKSGAVIPPFACRGLKKPEPETFNCIPPYATCGAQGQCVKKSLYTANYRVQLDYGQCQCDGGFFTPEIPAKYTTYHKGYFAESTTTQISPTTEASLAACSLAATVAITRVGYTDSTDVEHTLQSQVDLIAEAADHYPRGTDMDFRVSYTYSLPSYQDPSADPAQPTPITTYNPDHTYTSAARLALVPQRMGKSFETMMYFPLAQVVLIPNVPDANITFSALLPHATPTLADIQTWSTVKFNATTDYTKVELYNFQLQLSSPKQTTPQGALYGTGALFYDLEHSNCVAANTQSVDPDTGVCKCNKGFVGATCAESFCTTCNDGNTASCDQRAERCFCKSFYTGSTCSEAICSLGSNPCLTGDSTSNPNGFVSNYQCSACTCRGLFSGSNCKTCANACVDDKLGTSVIDENGECICKLKKPDSYHGNRGQCRLFKNSFNLNLDTTEGISKATPPQVNAFLEMIRSEFLTLTGIDANNIRSVEIKDVAKKTKTATTYTQRVTLTITPMCYRSSVNPRYYPFPTSAEAFEMMGDAEGTQQLFSDDDATTSPHILAIDNDVNIKTVNTYAPGYSIPPRNTKFTEVFGSQSVAEAYTYRPAEDVISYRVLLDKIDAFRRKVIMRELIADGLIMNNLDYAEGINFEDNLCSAGDAGCFTVQDNSVREVRLAKPPKKPMSPTAVAFIVIGVLLAVAIGAGLALYFLWYKPRAVAMAEARARRRKERKAQEAVAAGRSRQSQASRDEDDEEL